MTLKQLRYFIVVYQTRNFTRAAELLFVSQPAISKAIQELEAEWGVSLFIRNRKDLIPSPEGDFALKMAQSLVSQADSFNSTMSLLGNHKTNLSIVMSNAVSLLLYPKLISGFIEQHPDIDVRIIEVQEHADQRLKNDPTADILFMPNARSRFDSAKITCLPVLETEYVILAAPDTAMAKLECITDDIRCDKPLIADYRPTDLHKDCYIPKRLTHFLNGCSIRVLSRQIALNLEMITAGSAYGYFFRESAARYSELVSVPFSPSWHQSIDAYYPCYKNNYPALSRFIQYLETYDCSQI